MATFIKRWTTGEHLALLLPMVGFKLFWLAVLGAAIYNLFEPELYSMGYEVNVTWITWDTYIFLAGIAAVNLTSLYARRLAAKAKPSKLSHLAHGFATVALIISLVGGGIFGIGTFMSTLNGVAGGEGLIRAANVYLPILLDAALLIFVILKAFVSSKGEDDE